MNVLLVAEYIRSMSWSTGAWTTHLARALVDAGHHVRLACDGVEDPDSVLDIAGPIELIVRRPRRTLRGADPLGFQRWALERIDDAPGWMTWSFSRYAPARVWSPLGAPIVATLARAVATHRPLSAVMEVAHRPWAMQALLAERRARRAARRLAGTRGEPRVIRLTPASRFDAISSERLGDLRRRTRAALDIPAHAPVLLTSAVHLDRPGLAGMLRGFARARDASSLSITPAGAADSGGSSANARPTLLILGRKTHSIWTRVRRAGCLDGVRILGGTERVDAAVAASDLALVYGSRPDPDSTGRFLADALRLGCPVVAQSGATGSDLLRSADRTRASAGIVVDDPTPAGWASAIGAGLSRGWRAIAAPEALRLGESLSMERVARSALDAARRDGSGVDTISHGR